MRSEEFINFISICQVGTAAQVRKAIKAGADVNAADEEGWTPLMAATGFNNRKATQALIDAGADVNARDKKGRTPLMASDSPEVVKLLLKAGADIHATDKEGCTAVMVAAQEGENPDFLAALIKAGVDVNAKNEEGKTALMMTGNAHFVQLLSRAGADVNAQDGEGRTALMYAAMGDELDDFVNFMLEDIFGEDEELTPSPSARHAVWLIDALIKVGVDVNVKAHDGKTALMYASAINAPEVVDVLLDAGADANARDDDGNRALDYARVNERLNGTEALRRLEEASR